MIVYHGSNIEVKTPKILLSRKGRDFGRAFYVTPIKEQAEKWALRKAQTDEGSKPIVSVFEWDEDCGKLSYKNFANEDHEWLEMIKKCRNNLNYKHMFDIVRGKIADDNVVDTITFYVEGVINEDQAIERLKYQNFNEQVAFCSEKSLAKLKFLKSYEVKK